MPSDPQSTAHSDHTPAVNPAHCAVVLANHFQFAPDQTFQFARVESRMMLWCISGKGNVTINQTRFTMEPGAFLLLPWGHSIRYRAEHHDPFRVGGVHIIPDLTGEEPILYNVLHTPSEMLSGAGCRRDLPLPGLDAIVPGNLSSTPALAHLAEYCVSGCQRGTLSDHEAFHLGWLMIQEWIRVTLFEAVTAPAAFMQLLTRIRHSWKHPLSIAAIAAEAGCSTPTLNRMFRRHLGTSPRQWIIREQLNQAAHLLATTLLPIGIVAQQVGIDDPYYFTKLFTRHFHMPPTAWRRHSSPLIPGR